MVPKTRKKGTPKFEKRVELTDSGGWTHVTRGSKREPPDVEERRFQELTAGHQVERASDLTLEALATLHRQVDIAWQASQCCRELMTTIKDKVLTANVANIDRAICTGLGSVSISGPHVSRAKSMWQLVTFEGVIELLRSGHDIKSVYIQDPRFNELDREFFTTSRSLHVLRDPEAIKQMSTSTFLFAPCNEFTLLEHAFEVAYPALFLGNDIGDHMLHSIPRTRSLGGFLPGSQKHNILHEHKLCLSRPLQLGTLYWRPAMIDSQEADSTLQQFSQETLGTQDSPPSLPSAA